jgi:asparagine synthase (glutamine-hydrolysing)
MERVMGNLIYHLEDLKVGQAYPNYYVARLASKFVKVVLSGAGGDELFAGYPWRYYSAIHSESFKNYIESYYDYWQRLIPDNLKPTFFNEDIYCFVKDFNTKDIFRSVLNGYSHKYESYENYINSALYFELKTFLHGILLVEDKLSMAHSLETRVPMLDNEFVDFALKVPVKFKLSHDNVNFRLNENQPPPEKQMYSGKTNNGKLILRKALSRFVHEDYSNGKKQGFSGPDASWFKGESIEYVKNLLFNKDARIYNYIQQKTAQNLMNEHFEGKVNRRLLIWSFLCFEWWLKIFNNV